MHVYFSPLACSMAARIAVYEANGEATFVEVDPKTKRTSDGEDYRAVHSLGLVPALRTADGTVLTENAAILQYLAAKWPEAHLAPTDALGVTRLQQWLCFVGTELHKGLFAPLLDAHAPPEVKTYVVEKGRARLDYLAKHLEGREVLLDAFSVADAYLVTALGWSVVTPVKLSDWPSLEAYVSRLRQRPSVARAIADERPLYMREQRQTVLERPRAGRGI